MKQLPPSRKPIEPIPSAKLIFAEGDYRKALADYQVAKEWTLMNGLCMRDDLDGRINSPAHAKHAGWIIEGEIVDDPHWQVTIDFWCLDSAKELLKTLTPPTGATLQIFASPGCST